MPEVLTVWWFWFLNSLGSEWEIHISSRLLYKNLLFISITFYYFKIVCFCCLCTKVGIHRPQQMCGSQRTIYESPFSSCMMWGPGIKLRSSFWRQAPSPSSHRASLQVVTFWQMISPTFLFFTVEFLHANKLCFVDYWGVTFVTWVEEACKATTVLYHFLICIITIKIATFYNTGIDYKQISMFFSHLKENITCC